MIGVTLSFDDAEPVWREVPQVPSAGDTLSYEGRAYRVEAVAWFGTSHTWAAEARCTRLPLLNVVLNEDARTCASGKHLGPTRLSHGRLHGALLEAWICERCGKDVTDE